MIEIEHDGTRFDPHALRVAVRHRMTRRPEARDFLLEGGEGH